MKRFIFLNIVFLVTLSTAIAQSAEGGGAYIQGNGSLVNCVVTNNYALTGFGVSGNGGNVTNCNITNNFYLNTSIVNPGDMLMNDGTVYSPTYDGSGNLVFPTGYTAANVAGVCFWGNANNNYLDGRFWVISVDEVSRYWCPKGLTNGSGWNPVDIAGIYNYQDPTSALLDFDGAGNTSLIVTDSHFVYRPNGESDTLNTDNCAAKYCYNYLGTTGIWFLPSIGQLRTLDNALSIVNPILSKLGKTQIAANPYWSSDEYGQQNAWVYYFSSTTQPGNPSKLTSYSVRPMAIVSKSK